jgi:hypothetical protein
VLVDNKSRDPGKGKEHSHHSGNEHHWDDKKSREKDIEAEENGLKNKHVPKSKRGRSKRELTIEKQHIQYTWSHGL